MKTKCRLILLCYVFVFVFGNFSYAFAEKLNKESFIKELERDIFQENLDPRYFEDIEVPRYKYYLFNEHKKYYYKARLNNNRKYAISTELVFLNKTFGALGFGTAYALLLLVSIISNVGQDPACGEACVEGCGQACTEGCVGSGIESLILSPPEVILVLGVIAGAATICYIPYYMLKKECPYDYLYRVRKSGEHGLNESYASDLFLNFLTPVFNSVYIAGLINILEDDAFIEPETLGTCLKIGALYGLISCILGTVNLEKMNLAVKNRFEILPDIMYVNKNEPVITINLAWYF